MDTYRSIRSRASNGLLVLLSILVLLVCLFYAYAAAYLAPNPGFDLYPSWKFGALESCQAQPAWCQANQDGLRPGDQLLVIGGLTHTEWKRDRTRVPFAGYGPGERVPITLRRAGEERAIQWQMLGSTQASCTRRLLRNLSLSVPFWLAGTIALLFLWPRDLRWRLLITFSYVTAIWAAAGAHSALGVAYVSLVQHALAWLLVPIYFYLHLNVPSSLFQRHQRYLLPPLCAAAAAMALLELLQILPYAIFNLALLLVFLGSLGPLVLRLLARPSASDRLAASVMLVGAGLSGGPPIALWAIPALLGVSAPTGLGLYVAMLAVPLLPFVYVYAIYKHRLGALEFRANRLLGLYGFLLLYVTVFGLVFSLGSRWLSLSDHLVVFDLAVSTVFVVAAALLYARFQRLVGRLAYGTRYNSEEIISIFSNRIPAALSLETLARLLADEVMPSLLIHQSVLLAWSDGSISTVYARGVRPGEIPETSRQVQPLLATAGRYRPPLAGAQGESDWVRLAIPLEMRGSSAGIWLFGRRDPDDYYPQPDIALLTTLAGLVAVAIESARLYERAQREVAERKQAEEVLRESEERLRLVVQNMPVMLDALDADNRIIVWNQECERVTGYSAEEIVANPKALEMLYADSAYLQRVLAEWGEPGDFRDWELELTGKDGSVRAVVWSNMSRQFPIAGWASWAIGVDVTERKRAEEALRESEERYRSLFNRVPVGLYRTTPEGQILDANPAMVQMLGYSERESLLAANAIAAYVNPEDRRRWQDLMEREGVVYGFETQWRRGDGTVVWVRESARTILDAQGRVLCYQGAVEDITERKQAEEALREQEEMVRAILNAPTETMILVDDQMTVLALNQIAAERFGKSADELIGLRPEDFPPELLLPALAESRVAQICEAIRSGRPVRFEDERAGMVFDTSIYPVFDAQGEVKRLAVFAQDITARREAEQQAIRAERLAAMGQLAAALAHEINNPLQAIRGNLELLATFRLEQEEHRQRLSVALQEIDRLGNVARRVLDFARPAPDTRYPVLVAYLVQRTLVLLAKHLQIAQMHVTSDIPADLPYVFAAPDQIIQVLLNLTINAIEAMPDGGHLHISAAADGDRIVFNLTNDGPHLPTEHIKRIFDPFFTTKPGGTGLGLSISHSIVQQHGGTITVENQEGERGVAFTIVLPRARLGEEQEAA